MNWAFLYVAALYFGGVWIWRRVASPIPWRIAVLFFTLAVVFLFSSLVLNYTTVPADHLFTLYPWYGHESVIQAGNRHMNDVVMQMVPWAHQVRESWKRFEAPLWNAASGGGYPLLANGQSAALSPLRFAALPLNLAASFAAEAAMKILAALTFAYLYMRRRGRSETASVVTAISYGFCTFITIWLHFPHASVAAFVPAMFYAIDLLIERGSLTRVAFAAAVFATMLLGGHPETAGHAALVGAPYALFILATVSLPLRERARRAAALTSAAVLALLLALPFILPFIEALPRSQRFESLRAQQRSIARFPASTLVTFLDPSFLAPGQESKLPGGPEIMSGYAGVLGAVAWFAVAFDAVRRRRWRSAEFFYVIAALFLVGVVLGWYVFSDVVHSLPLFDLAANARLRFAIAWCAAVLAGEAVHALVERAERRSLLIGIAAVAICFGIAFLRWVPPHLEASTAAFFALPRFVVLLVGALIAIRANPRPLSAALVAAVLVDLWSFGRRWYPPVGSRFLFAETPLITELLRHVPRNPSGDLVPHRVSGTGSTLFPNSGAPFGFQDIRAHDPMSHGRFLGALRVYTGYTSNEYFAMLNKIDDPFLDFLNVRYIATGPLEDYRSERFAQLYQGPDGRIFENRHALPRFYAARNVFVEFDDLKRTQRILEHEDWANSVVLKYIPTQIVDIVRDDLLLPRSPHAAVATVKILTARAREFVLMVDAPRWTLITGSHPHWPGWRVYRGSERLHVFEVNIAFMGFVVPPGRSVIRILYVPRAFYVGSYIAMTTLVVLITGVVWSRRRRRAGA